jgi:epoxyqueuosine reductase QueG
MGVKEELRDLAHGHGMNLFGVSGVDRFATSPEGKHPCDVLPGCKSVIVVGVRLLDGTIQANFRAFEDGRNDLKGLYGTYGYALLPNFELTYVCYDIARHIEQRTEEVATPCSTGPMTNGAQISLRHAAVAAGLGEFGWIGIVLTPQYGPRNRFGVVLTTLELEPDPMYSGKPLCNPEKCGICTKVCPSGALSEYADGNPKHVEMGGKVSEYCQLDWAKCFVVEQAMTRQYGGREDYITTPEPTLGDVFAAAAKMPPSEAGLQHVESWHCGKCLSYCPAGDWGKRFKAKGLSSGAPTRAQT